MSAGSAAGFTVSVGPQRFFRVGWLCACLLSPGLVQAVEANADFSTDQQAGAPRAVSGSRSDADNPPVSSALYPDAIASLSDAELTHLSKRWSELGADQRRALLKAVQSRMVLSRGREQRPRLQLKRRFGEGSSASAGIITFKRQVRQADGTVRSSTQVLTFGAGFEQRAGTEALVATQDASGASPANIGSRSKVQVDVPAPVVAASEADAEASSAQEPATIDVQHRRVMRASHDPSPHPGASQRR